MSVIESEFNWSMRHRQIGEHSSEMHIPPDITFCFEDNENEIHAHKWMMAMVSPVFHKMFFVANTKDKDAKKLLIKGTTFDAFRITKDAIYAITSMENGLKGKSALEVFYVLDLVTRYQISELHQIVRNHLFFFPLTDDNVLEVAYTAMHNSSTFEEEAKQLLIHCAKFIKSKLKTAEAVFSYVASHKEDQDVVYHLLELMDGVCKRKALDEEPCSICFDDFTKSDDTQGKVVWCESGCGHNFHKQCMQMWLGSKHSADDETCPLCFLKLPPGAL